jgi:hypothetical protein
LAARRSCNAATGWARSRMWARLARSPTLWHRLLNALFQQPLLDQSFDVFLVAFLGDADSCSVTPACQGAFGCAGVERQRLCIAGHHDRNTTAPQYQFKCCTGQDRAGRAACQCCALVQVQARIAKRHRIAVVPDKNAAPAIKDWKSSAAMMNQRMQPELLAEPAKRPRRWADVAALRMPISDSTLPSTSQHVQLLLKSRLRVFNTRQLRRTFWMQAAVNTAALS